MTDMTQAIKPKSDQLNADDLIAGPITIKITGVNISAGEQPVSIKFEGDNGKPWKPCKSMSRVLVQLWGADAKQYTGRSLTLYRDPDVTWAGMKVGGIRISHMSGIDQAVTMVLTASKSTRKPYVVKPMGPGGGGDRSTVAAASPIPPAGNPEPAQTASTGLPDQEFLDLQNAINNCWTDEELAVARDKCTAARPRMSKPQGETIRTLINSKQEDFKRLDDKGGEDAAG